jgi:hypothetical protein
MLEVDGLRMPAARAISGSDRSLRLTRVPICDLLFKSIWPEKAIAQVRGRRLSTHETNATFFRVLIVFGLHDAFTFEHSRSLTNVGPRTSRGSQRHDLGAVAQANDEGGTT